MTLLERIKEEIVYFDGGTGTVLQEKGLSAGECPELWNLTHEEDIVSLHRAYLEAGCQIINTNTFGVNSLKYKGENGQPSVKELVSAAVSHVKEAKRQTGREDAYVALDIGPLGKLLEPFGDLPFEEAVSVFAETVRAGVECGVDLIVIETMNDAYETKAAVLAAKEHAQLPVFVTNVYDEKAKLMTGASPETMAAILESMGVSAIGMNCSLGPHKMVEIVPRLVNAVNLPVIVNPNAGLPRVENGETVYDVDAEEFSDCMVQIAEKGAVFLGGCCGTNPEFMETMIAKTKAIKPSQTVKEMQKTVSSYADVVYVEKARLSSVIGKTFSEDVATAVEEGDVDTITDEAMDAADDGADIICLNLDGSGSEEFLAEAVFELQSVMRNPLFLISDDRKALERAVRIYNGKPMIGSIGRNADTFGKLCKLAKKYGALVCYENLSPEETECLKTIAAETGLSQSQIWIRA